MGRKSGNGSSLKSIILSIFALILSVGLLFGIVILAGIEPILGVVGFILWLFIPRKVRAKAEDAANGVFDTIFAKYIIPVISSIIVLGAIFYIILVYGFGITIF